MLAGGYGRVWEELGRLFDELPADDRAAIVGGTAAEFYRIPADRLGGPAS